MKAIVALVSAALLLMTGGLSADVRRPTARVVRPAVRVVKRTVPAAPVRYAPTSIGVRFKSSGSDSSRSRSASASTGSVDRKASTAASTPPPAFHEDPAVPTKKVETTTDSGATVVKEVDSGVSSRFPYAGNASSDAEAARQKARNDAFDEAVKEYKKDHPYNPLPWEQQ